jgi:hypothetical protein
MPVDPSNIREFAKSGPVYMVLDSNEARRALLAGERDYCLVLGITVAYTVTEPTPREIFEQSPVIEVWDRNARTFNTPAEARELGLHFLGKTMKEILDNYRFTWAVASDDVNKARITGFSIQPGVRQLDGSIEWDDFVEIGHTQCRPEIRQALAIRPLS